MGEIVNMVEIAAGLGDKKTAPGRAALDAEHRRLEDLVAGA